MTQLNDFRSNGLPQDLRQQNLPPQPQTSDTPVAPSLPAGLAPTENSPFASKHADRKSVLEPRNAWDDRDSGDEDSRSLDRPKSRTPALDAFGRDITARARLGELDPVIGRGEEIERMLEILLRRTKNNPVMIGEAGVGKTAVVEGLAQRIARGEVIGFEHKRIIALDVTAMVAGTKYRGQFEERIKAVMNEAQRDKSIILFIDEIHTLVGAGATSGAMDAANILKEALSRGRLQTIGATTLDEYRKHIEKDPALARRFQPVLVKEPSQADTVNILKGVVPKLEAHHKLSIAPEVVELAVRLAGRFITERRFPDKAIDVLDEAAARVRVAKGSVVGSDDICAVVASIAKVPVGAMSVDEATKLLTLESRLNEQVIEQPEAVSAICRALRRDRTGLRDPNRPAGSFLLVGQTGLGKTHLMKVVAKELFGTEDALIAFDMSEYMEQHSVARLVGAPPGYVGYEEGGQLTERIRRQPYCVVLLDEIEKAHPDVQLLLLQILEEGRITDGHGRKVNCKNVVFAMTSNLGAEEISRSAFGLARRDDISKNRETNRKIVMAAVEGFFRPELLGRIDEVLHFNPFSQEGISRIAKRELKGFLSRVESKGYSLTIDPDVEKLIAEKGYSKEFGARPLRRAIQSLIEDSFVEAELRGAFAPGQQIIAVRKGDAVTYEVRREAPLPRFPEEGAISAPSSQEPNPSRVSEGSE